jgi:hypothetical protein
MLAAAEAAAAAAFAPAAPPSDRRDIFSEDSEALEARGETSIQAIHARGRVKAY